MAKKTSIKRPLVSNGRGGFLPHFGKQDAHIPPEEVEKIHVAHPEVEIYWYDAGHGFNCDARASYDPVAAKEARDRSLKFLKANLA